MWDPNTWVREPYEFRIYGNDSAQVWAVVDEEDYHHFVKWRWCPKIDIYKKCYLRRSLRVGTGHITFYLHIEIMKRTGILPPSPKHALVDHWDGKELNCRRSNLRWATHRENGQNRFGRANQLRML